VKTPVVLASASPVWRWFVPLLRTAMELEHAAEAPAPRPSLYVLSPAELRAWGVLAKRAQGPN
jgi:hypothetical protein